MKQYLKLNFMKNIDKDYFWLYISSNLWGTHYDTRKKLRNVLMCSFFVQKNEICHKGTKKEEMCYQILKVFI